MKIRHSIKLAFSLGFFFIFSLTACANKKNGNSVSSSSKEEKVKTQIVNGEIELPKPPESLSTPEEKARYILMHFWDPLDFSDTTYTYSEDFMEQNFANYVSLFPYATPEARKESVFKLLNDSKVDHKAYVILQDIAGKYLYDPNSPMLNEVSFIPFVEYELESESSSAATKEAAKAILESINKNRVGSIAADFKFEDRKGNQLSLYTIFPDREMMLIFYDPDCENCKMIMGGIINNKNINNAVETGQLGILAIYSGDNKDAWKEGYNQYPENWVVGYEPGLIEENELYDIRATPTIYILDKNKVVEEKDYRIQ